MDHPSCSGFNIVKKKPDRLRKMQISKIAKREKPWETLDLFEIPELSEELTTIAPAKRGRKNGSFYEVFREPQCG
jgi:hypothetical protein